MNKRILINASTVKMSGGLFVAVDIINAFLNQTQFEIVIVCPDIPIFKKLDREVTIKYVPKKLFNYLLRPILDFLWLPRVINRFDPEIVLSLSNLPARTNKYQIFMNDNAFIGESRLAFFHLSFRNKLIHILRKQIFLNRIRFIDRIVVQTEPEKNKLLKLTSNSIPVDVRAPLLPSHLERVKINLKLNSNKNRIIRIACLSRYYDHKNIEVIYTVAKLCAERQLPYQFILTIGDNQGKRAKKLLMMIQKENYNQRIINHGKVTRNKIVDFLQSVDALILPSLLESYSLNYLEAWYMEKHLFVSDRKFAREVCKQSAVYFNPEDPEDIVHTIHTSLSDTLKLSNRIQSGKEILRYLPVKKEIVQVFLKNKHQR